MNGNHENCAKQLDKLSQTVRTILLSLNDVIARVKFYKIAMKMKFF